MPRDRLPTALRSRKLHGTLLDPGQGATRMLASHLSQLAQHASSLTREEMSASVNAGLILLSGSLSTLRDGEDDGPARQVVRNGMRRLVREHIERHLDAGHLSPETIAAALGISRSSLYRLFLRDGGVNAYIQGRRLDRCFDELLLAAGGTSASRSLPTATASRAKARSAGRSACGSARLPARCEPMPGETATANRSTSGRARMPP